MKIVINLEYSFLRQFIEQLPVFFEEEGETIYSARNVIKVFKEKNLLLAVKRYRKPNFINRIIYANFRFSKAYRSYEYGLMLLKKGISVPVPVACIEEKRCGLLAYSYYVYLYDREATHIRERMLGNPRDIVFEKNLAVFIAKLHSEGILPLDLSPGNILHKKREDGTDSFSLIDYNRMKFMDVIPKTIRYKNFMRISENDDIINYLAKEYALHCHLNPEEAMREIYKYCYRFSDTMKSRANKE